MSEQDLARGLAALDDEAVRTAVAAGDLSAIEELELTDEEQALLVAAASDEAEVVGFGINASIAGIGGIQGQKVTPDVLNRPKTADKHFEATMNYLKG